MFTLEYIRPGHYDGMMKPLLNKTFKDRGAYINVFESEEAALEQFDGVLRRHNLFLDQAALAAFNRNQRQSVDSWRVGLLCVHPLPHSPKVVALAEVEM